MLSINNHRPCKNNHKNRIEEGNEGTHKQVTIRLRRTVVATRHNLIPHPCIRTHRRPARHLILLSSLETHKYSHLDITIRFHLHLIIGKPNQLMYNLRPHRITAKETRGSQSLTIVRTEGLTCLLRHLSLLKRPRRLFLPRSQAS